GASAKRRATPRRRPQAHRQGGSPAGGDCVLEPSSGPRPLDARAAGRRKVKVTERRAAEDFATCMRDLADVHYPGADRIRVVLDNLSTHSAGALYQTFPADEARRILRRLEFHYVPKHASWLNMVEIEIGVLAGQCLDRRIDSYARLVAETAAWEKRRKTERARINWMFTTEKARATMGPTYPKPAAKTRPTRKRQI